METAGAGAARVDVADFVVECRSESRGSSVPARFGRYGRMREVVAVLDRWDGDDHRYFRVRADDGSTYILRQDLGDASWQLHFYRRNDEVGGGS
jgi:hypothetical protein